MSILLAALLASKSVTSMIDRRSLDIQARAEALQPRRHAVPTASGGTGLDLTAITTICRAAGGQADPAAFLGTLTRAYSMSQSDAASLRTSCAAYIAGQADARRNASR